MRDSDAKPLGRWCARHKKQFRRVPVGDNAWATGCPDCLAEPDFAAAMQAMVDAVMRNELRKIQP